MEEISYSKPEKAEGNVPHRVKIKVGGETVGRASMHYSDTPFPVFEISLTVKSDSRGKGYGSKLLTAIEKYLKQTKRAGILVNVIDKNSPARDMYLRHGWKPVGPKNFLVYNLPKDASTEQLKDFFTQ